jgi:hypothetical protein
MAGITGLAGGGFPPHGSTALSTGDGASSNPPIPLGTVAYGSTGEKYVYGRGTNSTAQTAGTWVVFDGGFGSPALTSTGAGPTSSGGSKLGVTVGGSTGSTVGVSTSQYCWYAVGGVVKAHCGSTAAGSGEVGSRLYLSTTVAGAATPSSTPQTVQGAEIQAGNSTTVFEYVLLNDPFLSAT